MEPTKGLDCTSVTVAIFCLLVALGVGYCIQALAPHLDGWGAAALAVAAGILIAVCAVFFTRKASATEEDS